MGETANRLVAASDNANFVLHAVALVIACGVAAAPAHAGPAIGQFEIKSLGVTPGELEFQSQNAFAFGEPQRETRREPDGGLTADDNSIAAERYGLELEYGLTRYFKARVGIEFERERLDEPASFSQAQTYGDLKVDEYALESILVLIPRQAEGFALGVIVEYEHPAEAGGARTLTGGPIIEYATGAWRLTANPLLTQFFGGDENERGQRDDKIDFGYAARALYKWSDHLSLAVEAYGTVERIANSGEPDEAAQAFGDFDQHRVGPVVYWTAIERNPEVSLGVGVLVGLNEHTPDSTLKLSLEMTY